MIDIAAEKPVPLEDIATHCSTHFSTVYRWVLKGLPLPSGERVRLEALRVGGRWVSTWPALQRFAEATTPAVGDVSAKAPRSVSRRQQASEKAAKQLEAMGI
jgi:hypothetical protein